MSSPMNSHRIRAMVVDDEPLARQAIQQLLTEIDWIEWIGEAEDGISAIEKIRSASPDLLFMDIQMPGASGIEVLDRSGTSASVIFTTAYDEYAMTAFELGAIDYLRKPFGRERFMRALERAKPFLESRQTARAAESETPLSERLTFAQNESKLITRLFVRDRTFIVPVQTSDVLRFESEGDYVAVITDGRRHLVYINLAELSQRLDAEKFVRIHRSHIVNLDRVAAMVPHDANRLEVRMVDGARIVASRTGTQILRARIK